MTNDALEHVIEARLLRIPEVAERLGCSRPHVYRLIAQGVLPVVDISEPTSKRSKARVRLDHLQAYIEGSTWTAKAVEGSATAS